MPIAWIARPKPPGPAATALTGFLTVLGSLGAMVAADGCLPESDKDRIPPRVIGIDPTAPVVPVDTEFTVRFSEPIDPDTIDAEPTSDRLTVVLVPRAQVTNAFLTDFNNPGLIESRQSQVVPVAVQIGEDFIRVRPVNPLQARTAYVLLLGRDIRDLESNPIVDTFGLKASFRYDFATDDGQPKVLRTDVDGPSLVAPNRKRLAVTFNQPVVGVDRDSLTLTPAVAIEAILMDDQRETATILFGDVAGACERLPADTSFTLRATSDIIGDTTQALEPFENAFRTGAVCDATPHRVLDPPIAIAGESAATIRFETNKPSTTEVRFGRVGEPLDCLGFSCPVIGLPARTPRQGTSPPRYVHSLEIAGLDLGVDYRVIVSAEDDVGFVATGEVRFITAPLPKIAINEVMANPPAVFSPEARGEYVELYNHGDEVVDVSSWALLVEGGADGGGCTATLPNDIAIVPGGFLIVAGRDFEAEPYGLDASAPIVKLVRSTGANGMCALVNSRAQNVAVVDADGRPVSSMGPYPSILARHKGRSVERVAPDAPDVAESFCYSRTDIGPTPGRANGVAINGCG